MHHGTVLAEDGNIKLVPKNSPVMHCQCRYPQVSSATSEWRKSTVLIKSEINVVYCVSSVEIQLEI